MGNEKFPENINLCFQDEDDHTLLEQINNPKHHPDTGSSSLYGLVGNNITYITAGAYKRGYFDRMWHWAWNDVLIAFCGLLRVFFARDK